MLNQIKLGAIISYFALFLNIIIGIVYTPWVIISIGQSDYGLYTLAMSVITLLSFDFGLGSALTKFISQYLAEGRQDKINNLLGLVYKLYLGIDFIIIFVIAVMYFKLPVIYTGLEDTELVKFSNIFLIASLYCAISFPFIPINGILNSYEKFVQVKLCDVFNRLFIVLTMSLCLKLGYGLYALVFVNSLSGVLTICLKLIIIKCNTPAKINIRYWNNKELKHIFSFTLWVTIAALAQRLIFSIAPTILGIYSNSVAIGVLGVAITVESNIYLFANALNGMFLPKVSRLLNNNDPDGIMILMTKVGRIQIYIIGFLMIWLIVLGKSFINLWLDESYSLVYPCALLICIPSFFHLPQEIGLTYLIAANKVKFQAYIYLIMGVLNISLAIPLSSLYGSIGICLSICLSYLFRTAALDYVFVSKMNIKLLDFIKETYFKIIPWLLIVAIISYFISMLFISINWHNMLINSMLLMVTFVVIVYFGCMNQYEKHLFVDPFKRFLK